MEFVVLKNVKIKDEPLEYLENTESMEGVVVTQSTPVVEVDPMNLLEIVAERSSVDGQEKTSTGNGENDGSLDKWSQWIKTYPWLLRRAEEKRLGFCLYCGKNLHVEGAYQLERHNAALIHKERQQNYEAFLRSCKEALDEEGLNAIKEELDLEHSPEISEELITKRSERSKALNDFNWKHWLNAHKWLVRENSEDELSTKGYCKYCKCVFDVEFSLTRQRHEQAIKHKLGENVFSRQEKEEQGSENNEVNGNNTEAIDENTANNIDNHVASKVLKGRLFDKVANSSKRTCRVCRVVMDKHSCRKHMKSKLHRKNMQTLAISARKDKKISICGGSFNNVPVDWSKYTKIHSWICADPDDPKFAYCSYCEKRFIYGLSTVKRSLHEKSLSHCEAMKRKLGNREANNDMSESNGYQGNEDVNIENGGEDSGSAANESILKRKRAIYNDKWFEKNPCYQRNEEDEDYIYCKYCNVMLSIKNLNIGKHEKAERHRLAQKIQDEMPKADVPETNLQIPRNNHVSLSWMRRTKNGQIFCRFCRVILSQQYRAAVHERTERHKWAAQKYLDRKNEQDNQSLKTERKTFVGGGPQCDSAVSDEEMKPAIDRSGESGTNWQQKYDWLTFSESEIRQFYGYCIYCKQSVFVPTATFAAKHECSSNHIRSQLNQQRGQSDMETSQVTKSEETHKYKLYKWLLPDPEENRNFGYCKYCKTRVMTEGLMALGHHNSRSHRKATQLYLQNQKNDCSDDTNQSSMLDNSRTDQLNTMESIINPDESGSEMSLAIRLNNAHTEMLSLIREMKGNKRQNNITTATTSAGELSAVAALASSDGDNICYSRVSEHLNGKLEFNTLSQQAKCARERNTYDLFFESMNEAVKKLPTDLAAESRVKIMQIVYDLEMRALQRKQSQSEPGPITEPSSPQTATTTTGAALQEPITSISKPNTNDPDDHDEVIPDSEGKSTNPCTDSDTT